MKISLEEAIEKLHNLEGKRFSDIATPDLINKGSAGQIIEKAIGLDLSSDLLDFTDGELKSNKFLKGKPAETLAVTQVGHTLEEISNNECLLIGAIFFGNYPCVMLMKGLWLNRFQFRRPSMGKCLFVRHPAPT